MPRGRQYAVYVTDEGQLFARLVDRDLILQTQRGWTTTDVELLPRVPRGFAERYVTGVSPVSGRTAKAVCATPTCALWLGLTTTFDTEATDGTIDTFYLTGRSPERYTKPRA
jgi:hypothetical protein